jgi:hypothetical protein
MLRPWQMPFRPPADHMGKECMATIMSSAMEWTAENLEGSGDGSLTEEENGCGSCKACKVWASSDVGWSPI